MRIEIRCERCEELIEVEDRLAGGLTNCPRCGRATPVPGLRDPIWRLIQLVVLGLAVSAVVLGWQGGAPLTGAAVAVAVLAAGWLVARAL